MHRVGRPRVSVIITTHSRPALLTRAIESAHGAAADVEVVVVDDASIDSTREVCQSRSDIHYIRLDKNLGTAGARNVGIAASSGQYLSFHDDDDLRFAGTLDRQCDLLDRNPEAVLCYGRVAMGDQNCEPTGFIEPQQCESGDLFWKLLSWNSIMCLSAVFRREVYDTVGPLNPELTGIDDWDYWVRLAEVHPFLGTDEVIGIWRESTPSSGQGSSASTRLLLRCLRHQQLLLQLPRAKAATPAERRAAQRQRLDRSSDWLIYHASEWLKRGATAYARNCLITALRLNAARALRPWTLQLIAQSLFSRPSVSE